MPVTEDLDVTPSDEIDTYGAHGIFCRKESESILLLTSDPSFAIVGLLVPESSVQ